MLELDTSDDVRQWLQDSSWSLPNLKRARRLIEQGRMTEAGMAALPPEFAKQ